MQKFQYMLLGRLKQDCDYFIGNDNKSVKNLWAGSVESQINKMTELYNILEIKPEWLTMDDIKNYHQKMLAK